MLAATFVFVLVFGIVLMILGDKWRGHYVWGWGLGLTMIGGILTFLVWGIIYIDSYMSLTKMEAFYDANRAAYESTVNTTKNAVYQISKDSALRIDVENLKQSTNWSERLAEFRDAVIEYNTCIYKLRRYNSSFVLSAMFANPREDLKLITLKE